MKINNILQKPKKLLNKIIGTLKNIWNDCKLNIKELIVFEMLYKLIVFFIFTPLIYFVLKVSVNEMGFFNLTNNELINLGLKIPGIICIILIMILAFISIFIELGVLTYIANQSYLKRKASIGQGLINTIKIVPHTIGIYILPILFICVIMGPIAGIGLNSSLIKDISIPLFIKVELHRSGFGKIFLILAIVLLVIISLRWILFLPITVIEKVNLKEALKKSRNIYKIQKLNIIKYLILWIAINLVFKILPLVSYVLIGELLIHELFLMKLYLLIFIIAYTFISLVTVPFFITFLVEVYYKLRGYNRYVTNSNSKYDLRKNKIYIFINNNKNIVLALIIVAFSAMVFYTSFNNVYKGSSDKSVLVTAHRGYNIVAPENSMSAISLAGELLSDYVEIDAMTTKDNKVVIFHDTTTKRFDGKNRKIKDMTLEEVKHIDIGSAYDNNSKNVNRPYVSYKGETVPTLEEVFKTFKGKIKFNIELKPNGKNDILENEVAKLIKKYSMENDVIISSLNYNSLNKFKDEKSGVKVGYILTFGIGDFTKLDVDFVSVEYGMLSKELVDAMHKLGKEVHVWTLNKEEEIVNAAALGVDNIITDEVWGTVATLVSNNYKSYMDMYNYEVESGQWLYNNIRYILRYVNI
ncbi:MAG: glycerophosphoryl diester phosphodiesterase membrane domain-containing protein [Peptostreptococcaceae bacterium]